MWALPVRSLNPPLTIPMKKVILMAVATAITLGAMVQAVSPDAGASDAKPGAFRRCARELVGSIARDLKCLGAEISLTDEQRGEIQRVLKSHKADFTLQFENGRAARRAMQEAVEKNGPDSPEAAKAADAVAAVARSRALLIGKISSEIRPLLTPEQLGRVKATREHIENSVDDFFGKISE